MRENQVEGVRLLQGELSAPSLVVRLCCVDTLSLLCKEIYRAEPTRRRECLYYLALGHYKMGNYDEAKKFNGAHFLASFLCSTALMIPLYSGLLIDKEPTNMQALSLATLIDKGVTRGLCRFSPNPTASQPAFCRRLYRHGTSRRGSRGRRDSSGRSHTASSSQMIFPLICATDSRLPLFLFTHSYSRAIHTLYERGFLYPPFL
jgi:hypothetical protein